MKRKFMLWLNILTICLCVCAIAIGMYAFQNASLTVGGSVGFKAHNCDVDITVSLWGDSVETDSSTSASVPEGQTVRSKTNPKRYDTVNVRGKDEQLDLTTIYFGDKTNDGSISPITIDFAVENKSVFAVAVEITNISIKVGTSDCTYITYNSSEDLILTAVDTGDTSKGTLSLELTLTAGTDTLTEIPEISFNISMYKHVASSTLSPNWNSTDSSTMSNGIFSTASPFGDEIPTLTMMDISSVSFLRELPANIDTYAKAESLNLTNDPNTESPITAYAKKASTTDGLYDVIIYSPGKIYAEDCVGMFSPAKSLEKFQEFFFESLYGRNPIYYKNLTNINFDNLYIDRATNTAWMFCFCESLINLDISNFNTSKVTDMRYMFGSCSGLIGLDVSNFDTSSVTDMSYMFYSCGSLTSLDVSNFNTSKVTNMGEMFGSCSGLTSLDLSNFDTSSVTTDMTGMFSGCSSLASLNVSNFDTSSVTDMSYMFYDCSSLESLDLSSFYTIKVANMSYMFYNCSKLTTIYVKYESFLSNNYWKVDNVTDSSYMFYNCTNLTGGAGTKYKGNDHSSYYNKTYARIDTDIDSGYLTQKTA